MHVRGKSYRYELESGGKRHTILDIPHYDFNWQTTYALAEPRKLDGGERFLCTAVFDNSEQNLNNPDPTKTVRWGDQTWDEMMIGYYHFAVPLDNHGESVSVKGLSRRERLATLIRGAVQIRKFDELDSDRDGRLLRGETPWLLRQTFDRLDANRDQVLTRDEVILGDS